MRIWDAESDKFIDVDPVQAAAGMLARARRLRGEPGAAELESQALRILREAATACPRCGAYGDQPHPDFCLLARKDER
jgi:hypothetical protein